MWTSLSEVGESESRRDSSTWLSGILPPPVSASAVSHYCRVESARHLDDVMIRRTSWRHYHRNHLELAANVADWMAAELGWDHGQRAAELERYRRLTGATPLPAPHILAPAGAGGNGHKHERLTDSRIGAADVAGN
jgi:hypothetical protein